MKRLLNLLFFLLLTGASFGADYSDSIPYDPSTTNVAPIPLIFQVPIQVPDNAYNATTWNNSLKAPNENSVRDQLEALLALIPDIDTEAKLETEVGVNLLSENDTTGDYTVDSLAVDTEVYDATGWNGDNTVPTKDAVRDKIETLSAGTATALNDIEDSDGNGAVSSGHTHTWTFTLDGSTFLTFLSSDADNASDTTLLSLDFTDSGDANSVFLQMRDDAGGTPNTVYKFTASAFTSTASASFGSGNGQVDVGSTGIRLTSDGDGAMTWLGLGDGNDEDLTWNLDDTANTGTVSSSTGLNVLNFSGISLQQSGVGVVGTDRTITVAGTANEITSSAGAQDLSANRTWTLSLPSVIDLGGKTLEIPNSASDAALSAGQISLNTTDKQLSIHNGTKEVAIPLVHTKSWSFDPDAVCDGAVDRLFLCTVASSWAPEGITITGWRVSFEADPTTEADLDLKFADAFIGVANATVMDVLDTTAGVSSETSAANINGGAAVAAGKVLYLEFGTAYTESNHQIIFEMDYEIEED